MSVTIDQIAAQIGVSSSTVARVLRGDVKGTQQRSAAKVREILRVSEELGYRPNWRARALSRGKTHTIGLLYSNPMWIFEEPMNEIAVSFTQSLQVLGYDLRLIPVSDDRDWEGVVYGGGVDGVAFFVNVPEQAEDVLNSGRLPIVLVGDKRPGGPPHVVPEDEMGGYLAARHLLGLGHKKIVYYVADTIRTHYSVEERRQGYERAMREAGQQDNISFWHCEPNEAFGRLLGPAPPTAIICYCQVEALHIIHGAWSHGLTIPTDFSLIAFNDLSVTKLLTPPLTVVGFDCAAVGRIAAEMLASIIEGDPRPTPPNVVVRHKLVVRGTTAPPSSS